MPPRRFPSRTRRSCWLWCNPGILPPGEEAAAEADEVALRAPAAAVYKTHSTSIVYALEDLKGMPEGELADLRKAETDAQHNYDMLEQSLEDLKAADGKRPGG